MIADALWWLIDTLLGPVISALPTEPVLSATWGSGGFQDVAKTIAFVDRVVPVQVPLMFMIWCLGTLIPFFLFRVAEWLYSKIPGKAT